MPKRRPKLDNINRKILAVLHRRADLTNVELAELVGLSPSACFQRMKALKNGGYIFNFMAEVDLARICPEHVLAYLDLTLRDNGAAARRQFALAIEQMPEIMDCLRVAGDVDYVALICCSNVAEVGRLCDRLAAKQHLGIIKITTRVVLDRAKWRLGYPVEKLRWIE